MNQTGLRFVVLHHTGIPEAHFDFMVETSPGSPLATWRFHHWPPGKEDHPTVLAPHRREYLEFEGTVSGGRGRVKRIAAGTAALSRTETTILARLDGKLRLELPREKPKPPEEIVPPPTQPAPPSPPPALSEGSTASEGPVA